MTRVPRFRLWTLFFLISCAAVGLAAKGVLYAAYVAMVVGLVQQIRQLRSATRTQEVRESSVLFALRYATLWRLLLAVLMSGCIIFQILLSQGAIRLPDRQDLLLIEPDYDVVAQVCAIVVLSNSLMRWRVPRLASHGKRWTVTLAWIAGATLAAFVLPDVAIVHFLVHIATQGIEYAIPRAFQRAGVFPDHRAEGFRLFWVSVGAACTAVMAAALLSTLSSDQRHSSKRQWLTIASFLTMLSMSCAFCVWYYGSELPRISPDLASVRPTGIMRDWFGAGALLAILVTTQAYRFACDNHARLTITKDLNECRDPPLHESFFGLLYLGGFASFTLFGLIRGVLMWPTYGVGSIGDFIVGLLTYPPYYIWIALSFLSLQLCWTRWRRRSFPSPWELTALSRGSFIGFWIALAAVAIVGLATVSIYCFDFWLGPWYLIRR
jgi:hypothetical protein